MGAISARPARRPTPPRLAASHVAIRNPDPPLRRWPDLSPSSVPQVPDLAFQVNERHRCPPPRRPSARDRRPIVVDQRADRLRGFCIGRHGAAAGSEPAEQPQQQQRLVRRPEAGPADRRTPQPRQQLQQLITRHPGSLAPRCRHAQHPGRAAFLGGPDTAIQPITRRSRQGCNRPGHTPHEPGSAPYRLSGKGDRWARVTLADAR
jgi:hypothetical protein